MLESVNRFFKANNYMNSLNFEFRCAQPDQMSSDMYTLFLSTASSAVHNKVTWCCKLSATKTTFERFFSWTTSDVYC